jgi:phosphatidylcholine synthase
VDQLLPRFSGARLDLVVDYLNFCVVPAFIVVESGLAGEGYGLFSAAVILLSSLFHFSDVYSKTGDGFFVGFPTLWNVVCLYFFVFDMPPGITLPVILTLAAATFIPVKWVHPVRVNHFKGITMVILLVWSASALHEVILNFPGTMLAQLIFALTAAYLVAIGIYRTLYLGDPDKKTPE